jgi:glycine/D-amino acid oxidase-like deaminating enzyme
VRQLIIIGSGPAGLTAAIYAARANLEPLVVASSVDVGGELMNTTEVENYPGFPDGIQGPELMAKFQEQAEKFGAEILYDDAVELELDGPVKRVILGSGKVEEAEAVIFATGSAYRKIGTLHVGSWMPALLRFAAAAVPAGLAGWGTFLLLGGAGGWMLSSMVLGGVGTAVICSVSLVVYVLVLALVRAPELGPALQVMQRFVRR